MGRPGSGGSGLFTCRPKDTFEVGAFDDDVGDELQDTLNPLVDLENERGLEVYYSFSVTPWCFLTADVQVVDPTDHAADRIVALGLRLNLRL